MSAKELLARHERAHVERSEIKGILSLAWQYLRRLKAIVDETAIYEDFGRAVLFLEATTGAIVTTGVGKSAFVAQRLAASLRLIGWRAWFMHPTEAMHGDIGGVMEGDILIAVSRSGDTDEVVLLLQWAHAHEMVNILISGNPEGYGRDSATVSLLHPNDEIDPSGTIPSASIVAAEMVADTLVATLYARRGDQGLRKDAHPGGTLGRRATLTAKDVMVGWPKIGEYALPWVLPEASLQHCLQRLGRCRGTVLVVEHANQLLKCSPLGVITAGDIARGIGCPDGELLDANDVMTTWNECTWCPVGMLVTEAIELMKTNGIMALPVVAGEDNVVGILHLHDCLRAGVL